MLFPTLRLENKILQQKKSEVVLRKMTRNDIDSVVAIEAVANPEPWPLSLFEGEFKIDPGSRCWLVACFESQVVGFGGIMFAENVAKVLNLALANGFRRQRVASRLVQGLLIEASDRNYKNVELEVRQANSSAVSFYEHFGFEKVGVKQNYYGLNQTAFRYSIMLGGSVG